MNPFERKLVHDAVAEIDGVESSSRGEEPDRFVVIRKPLGDSVAFPRRMFHVKHEGWARRGGTRRRVDRPSTGQGSIAFEALLAERSRRLGLVAPRGPPEAA